MQWDGPREDVQGCTGTEATLESIEEGFASGRINHGGLRVLARIGVL
jgi:hypothetical protein